MTSRLSLLLWALFFSMPLQVEAKDPPLTPHVQAQLVGESRTFSPGKPVRIAVRLEAEEGWHTYWAISGDSGKPTRLEWSVPQGFVPGPMLWPAPKRIEVPPLVNYGYDDEAFLMTDLETPSDFIAESVQISVRARWLVCKESCLPGEATLSLTLMNSDGPPEPNTIWSQVFQKATSQLPQSTPTTWKAHARQVGQDWILQIENPSGFSSKKETQWTFFPLQDLVFQNAAPQSFHPSANGMEIKWAQSEYLTHAPDTLEGVLVERSGNGSTEKVQAWTVVAPLEGKISLAKMLFFALLGGILLNLMPCVFPVLALKAVSLLQKSGKLRRDILQGGLAYSAGVLFSFWIFSAVLIALRHTGDQVGWGFQLQSPGFVGSLSAIFFLLGLSLLGVLEIGSRWMGLGQSLTTKEGLRGAFATGMLSTIVATPCTAPFMGSAVGYALTQSDGDLWIIMTALAVGLALPYLLLTVWPPLLRWLPKPGAWMETLKQLLAFPLFATVIWLIWIETLLAGSFSLFYSLGALLALGWGVWFQHRWRTTWAKGCFVLLCILAGLLIAQIQRVDTPLAEGLQELSKSSVQLPWRPYHKQSIQKWREDGYSVFVNFTAAWCVTCQVNDRTTFRSPSVLAAFRDRKIIWMKADWTLPNPGITADLQSMKRSGVPVYAYYSKDLHKEIQLLPEILTPPILMEALQESETSK